MINISLSSAEDVDLDQLPIHLKSNSKESRMMSPCYDMMNNFGQTPTPGLTTDKR